MNNEQPMKLVNMREFKKVYMVNVREGEGIESDPSRIVHYIYTPEEEYIGKIDVFSSPTNS